MIFTGVGLGAGIAPPLVAYVMFYHGWRVSFFVCAAIGVIAGVIWYALARDTPNDGITLRQAPQGPPLRWGTIVSDRNIILLTISYFCYGYAAWIFFSWFFIYLRTVRGMDLKSSALYGMLPFIGMAVGSLLGGFLSDRLAKRYGRRVGRAGVAMVGISLAAVCLAAGMFVDSPQLASLVLAGGAGTLYLAQSSFWSVSADISGPSTGAVSAVVNMGAQVGGMVTVSLTPYLADKYGWTTPFLVAAALCVIGALAWIAIRPDRMIVAASALVLAAAGCTSRQSRDFHLEVDAPAFGQLVPAGTPLARIATGFGFTEGPAWDPANFLYVSDETQDSIFRVYMDGRKVPMIHLGDPDGNILDGQRRLIDGASALRAVIAITPDGQYTTLADRYEGKRFNSPNDIVIGPDSALYFTDPTLDLPKGQAQEIPFQGVYRLDHAGHVTLLTKELTQPNGLAFSPDGTKLYIDDSDQQNIRVYDFANGAIANGRIFVTEPGPKANGVPDGMRVDVHGNIFVTGPLGIWVWDPEGHHLGTIAMPEQPANLTWGDADYGTLYITATTSVYKLRTATHGIKPYPACAVAGPTATLSIPHVSHPGALSLDPASPTWSAAGRTTIVRDCSHAVDYPRLATDVRAFWSDTDLYVLFAAPYDALNLWLPADNGQPRMKLWDRDVVELFLGSDWKNIRHYREFEIAPTADWIDLAIDLDHPDTSGKTPAWRSGWHTMARIDRQAHVWYAAARIPLRAIDGGHVAAGTRWRMNLYRIEGVGADPQRRFMCWQPTCAGPDRDPNHVPEHFGTLVFTR